MAILNSISCFTFSAVVAATGVSAFAQHEGHGAGHGAGHGEKHEAHKAELPAPSGAEQVIKVKGMVCEICAAGIKKKLLKEKEVKSVDVKIKDHEVKIIYKDPKQLIPRDRLSTLLKEAGYELN